MLLINENPNINNVKNEKKDPEIKYDELIKMNEFCDNVMEIEIKQIQNFRIFAEKFFKGKNKILFLHFKNESLDFFQTCMDKFDPEMKLDISFIYNIRHLIQYY